MEKEQFRNYNVCAKVTANQKKLYTELATKSGLSLSEWLGSRIDMSIENEYLNKAKRSDRRIDRLRNETYNYKDSIVSEKMVTYHLGGIINNSSEQKQIKANRNNFTYKEKTQPDLDNSKQFLKEINFYNSTAKTYHTIGLIAFLGAILFKQN